MVNTNYYWIKATDQGKPYLIFGGIREDDARAKGLEMLPGVDFELVKLPTRNLQRASAMVRGTRLEETHNLRKASARIGHDRSIKRNIHNRRR
jgi:hypothetical protein